MGQGRWRVLVERYAVRAREFSDAVALLGKTGLSSAERRELLEAIRERHDACMAAADEVKQYIEQKAAAKTPDR
jgi:hypothetical protein